jgi:GntR family transcriptional regulator, transcriptional repressor for pyruvate dehydrogenase complex
MTRSTRSSEASRSRDDGDEPRTASSPPSRSPERIGVRRSRKVAEVVAREILQDALRRKLPPGSRLPPESEMLATFDVGRGSLREALRILEVHGLLTIRPGPGGGPVLREVSSQNFGATSTLFFMAQGSTYRDVITARTAVNPLMARLAAERIADDPGAAAEAERRMTESIEITRAAIDAEDRDWFLAATAFYLTIADLCGNEVIAIFGRSLQDIYMAHIPAMTFGQDHRRSVVALHERIARAILRGDGRGAERMMRERSKQFSEDVAAAFPGFMDDIVNWD